MANEGDHGHVAEEFFRQMAIENARNATGNERLTGFCQNDCGERTHGAFCSADCRNDFNARQRMKG